MQSLEYLEEGEWRRGAWRLGRLMREADVETQQVTQCWCHCMSDFTRTISSGVMWRHGAPPRLLLLSPLCLSNSTFLQSSTSSTPSTSAPVNIFDSQNLQYFKTGTTGVELCTSLGHAIPSDIIKRNVSVLTLTNSICFAFNLV